MRVQNPVKFIRWSENFTKLVTGFQALAVFEKRYTRNSYIKIIQSESGTVGWHLTLMIGRSTAVIPVMLSARLCRAQHHAQVWWTSVEWSCGPKLHSVYNVKKVSSPSFYRQPSRIWPYPPFSIFFPNLSLLGTLFW